MGRDKKVIDNINLHIKKGENVAIIGLSGSGKSTLLNCINRLVEPTSGEIFIDGKNINNETEKVRGDIGMIFQNFNLVNRETVWSNVMNGRLKNISTVRTILNRFSRKDKKIVAENIKLVGLEKFAYNRVTDLSGGQKQRVAIARALSQNPKILLADEPVSNLDPKLMNEILDLLKDICDKKRLTVVASLHFLEFVKKYSTRVIGIKEGKIIYDGDPNELTERDIVDIYGETKDWCTFGKIGF
jgi:phosphonate transport system ATP-binding protein